MSFERWFAALKAGHTFVTTGPVLLLKVNDRLPGDSLDVKPGSKLHITAEANGQREQIPLRSLEIIGHGKVLKRVEARDAERLSIDLELPVERGIWIAAKCEAGKAQVAHTTPVYVTVNGGGFFNPITAPHYLEVSERYLQELEQEMANPSKGQDFQAARHRDELEKQIADARRILKDLAEKLQ